MKDNLVPSEANKLTESESRYNWSLFAAAAGAQCAQAMSHPSAHDGRITLLLLAFSETKYPPIKLVKPCLQPKSGVKVCLILV